MKNPTRAELNTIGETVKAAKFDKMYLPPSVSPSPVIRDMQWHGPEYERRKWLRDMVTMPPPAYPIYRTFTNR